MLTNETYRRCGTQDELYNAIRDITNGGPHSVIETAGNKTTIRQAGELVRRGGTVVLVAMTGEGTIPFNMDAIKGKEAQIRPVFRYRDMFPKCISAVTNDIKCDIKKVISDYYSFDEIQKAYEDSVFRKNEIIKAAVIID